MGTGTIWQRRLDGTDGARRSGRSSDAAMARNARFADVFGTVKLTSRFCEDDSRRITTRNGLRRINAGI
jgi:hypothetical protein